MSKERELLKQIQQFLLCDCEDIYGFAADIEEILTQPEQEPVAWMNESGSCFLSDGNKYSDLWTPLYTAPPKREPLSDETIAKLWGESYSGTTQMVRNFARAIEKAHGIGGEE